MAARIVSSACRASRNCAPFSSRQLISVHPLRSSIVCRQGNGSFNLLRAFSQSTKLRGDEDGLPDPLPFPLEGSMFEHLRSSLIARELPLLFDTASSTPSRSLYITLSDFLPMERLPCPPPGMKASPVRFGRHLIYFPPQNRLSDLLPDATDPLQSPGRPFDRRMWAGGRITQGSNLDRANWFGRGLPRDVQRLQRSTESVCRESIVDVKLKGSGKDQKLFITLERRIAALPTRTEAAEMMQLPSADNVTAKSVRSEALVRKWLDDVRNCGVIERRDLVFMPPREAKAAPAPAEAKQGDKSSGAKAAPKVTQKPGVPDFSVELTPSASLLFRFSALTFNAHHIHLDKAYCRDIEGHRNLLVHGPLSCTLMMETLGLHLKGLEGGGGQAESFEIRDFQYRNLAPLYAEEPLRVCLRRKEKDLFMRKEMTENVLQDSPEKLLSVDEMYQDANAEESKTGEGDLYAQYDCWVENSEGRMCVRGTAYCFKKVGPIEDEQVEAVAEDSVN